MPETRDLFGDIKQIIDITSRVDERMKVIGEAQQQINIRLNTLIDEHNAVIAKVHVLENFQKTIIEQEEKLLGINSRVKDLEEHKETIIGQFKSIMGYIWHGAFIILMCYLLYRMGLSTPPIP